MWNGTWAWPAHSVLGRLDTRARQQVLALGETAHYPNGRVLIREGDQSTFVVVLLAGTVKVTGLVEDSREALLAVSVGGDLVGEFGVMDGAPRSATVTACGAVVARLVRRDEFLAWVWSNQAVAAVVVSSLTAKLRASNTRRLGLAGSNVPTRVARVLHDLAQSYGEPRAGHVALNWPLTQTELASLVGAAEPSVQKALRALREAGVLTTGYRRFEINDLERLKTIAYS